MTSGCSRTCANSARVSAPGLSRIRLEIASLPMSCSSAARRRSLQRPRRRRRARPARPTAISARAVGVAVGPRRLRVDRRRRTRTRSGRGASSSAVSSRSRGSQADDVAVGERVARTRASSRTRRARRRAPGRTTRRCACAATPRPRSTPPSAWKISAVWARHRMRPSSGISSPRSPRGWPPPSQCSSSARIASAVSASRPSSSAISAPRSQRACISARVTCALVLDREQPVDPRAQRAAGRDGAQRPHERGEPRPTSRRAWTCAWRRGRRRRTAPPSAPSSPSSPASLSSSA